MSHFSDTTLTVVHFLDRLSTKEKKCIEALKLLGKNPFKSRARCDIKKLKRKKFYVV